jgi:hypothetical protein
MLFFPKIAPTASNYPRLEKLARVAAQQGEMDEIFLLGEITRAKIIPGEANELRSLVTIGSWSRIGQTGACHAEPCNWFGRKSIRLTSPASQFCLRLVRL